MLGYSPSNFVQTDSSSRFSNSLSRIDQAQTIRDMQLSPVPPPRIVSPDVVEEVHKIHLQMYVFVLRCIAYPFTVGLPQDPVRRYLRLTKEYFNILKDRFTAFLNKDLQITCDEAFYNAVEHFYEIFLKSENVERMVKTGAFSMHDIREVFISSIEQRLVRFSEIDGLPKQTVISAWKIKFDQICRGGEGPCPIANRLGSQQLELTNPTREQLYEIFMRILSIKKYEHQILFNACQLDSVDEQAAQVRRELASQKSFLEEMAINRQYPKMVHKEMEVQYVEEQLNHVNQLMLQLDSVPVGKSHTYTSPSSAVGVVVQLQRRLQKKCSTTGHAGNSSLQPDRNGAPEDPKTVAGTAVKNAQRQAATFNPMAARPSLIGGGWTDDSGLDSGQQISVHHSGSVSKLSIQLSFHLEVSICQLRPLRHLSGNKQLFCTIELDGSSERQRTASVKACKPIWDTIAEFETSHPLPCLKIKLMKESNGPLSLDDKELGRNNLEKGIPVSFEFAVHIVGSDTYEEGRSRRRWLK
nr:unnamed protein product [Spirometra erinaceieuropaei]